MILYDEEPTIGTIFAISTHHRMDNEWNHTSYLVVPDFEDIGETIVEKNVFTTKEELLESL